VTGIVREICAFSPSLAPADSLANYWLRQVMVRLRREVCWMWQERTGGAPSGIMPPLVDRLSESLDQSRYWEEKQRFFQEDATARYLTEQIVNAPPAHIGTPSRGSFGWVIEQARLDEVSTFLLSLSLMSSFDSASGSVIAACHNDSNRTVPTLALAQKLWDRPEEVLGLADPVGPLFSLGLLCRLDSTPSATNWDAPLYTPELTARRLLFPDAPRPSQLTPVRGEVRSALTPAARVTALRLRPDASEMRIIPVTALHGAALGGTMTAIAEITGRPIVQLRGPVAPTALALCWLDGADLLLRSVPAAKLAESLLPWTGLPITVFVENGEFPQHQVFAELEILPLSYTERIQHWSNALGPSAPALAPVIAETARRFRYQAETIDRIAGALTSVPAEITPAAITTACRSATRLELGDMAQRVTPRFDGADELFLPARQSEQFREVLNAMRNLTEVHYRWGMARMWNESGISVLFAGPPGTGKTMASEILASELNLPMYRIDLSQVVNKYIGETEKNLKRIFDAADISDALLLFDEADAIFGKRVEARDAHDRYANLEISYLLDRMERFKGLAVLATNRKKDLDEAFLRRLRYMIDFPLPGVEQRLRIWRQSVPEGVDVTQVEFAFLASRFPLAGGHIRSVVFNACLQSARGGGRPALGMETVLMALKRELDKINRPVGLDQFGEYAPLIRRMERDTEDVSD
jgi:hypothetical protein